MKQVVTLGLLQMSMSKNAAANREKAETMICEAAKRGATVVCLPELFTSPYICQLETPCFDYAETIPGPTSTFLQNVAKRAHVWLVGGSIHEKFTSKFYNTTIVCSPQGELLGTYRKTHIPHDPSFFEQNYFQPGDTGFKVFDLGGIKTGTLICYDQWYPEAARANALLGAALVFYPTAIGTFEDSAQKEGNWQEAWENVQRGHAIANGMVVAAVNRVGKEDAMTFWGGSFVCDAFGKTLARGGKEEEIITATIDLEHGKFVREGWRFFYNRRPEMYSLLTHQ